MTIENGFPVGYFYIISKFNGLAIDVDTSKPFQPGSSLITAIKKEDKAERDSQLWMHQSGFLTNKASGLVMDVDSSKKFIDIFTGHNHLFLDSMKEAERAEDQRFGFSSETGYIYTLADENKVVDIRKGKAEAGATVMIYEKNENIEEGLHQLWSLQLADPPKIEAPNESSSDDDNDKSARLSAWFGSWFGWAKRDKDKVLQEKELQKAHDKVYNTDKKNLSYEVIAGAVAVQAVQMYIQKQEQEGESVYFKGAKEAIAGFAAKEMVKMFSERGTDEDDEDDDEEQRQKKESLLQKMAQKAAINYFETKVKDEN